MNEILPNLFIIGAPKNGTTALAYNLAEHKDIFIPNEKEPRYFDAHIYFDYEEDYPIKDLKEYLELYDCEDSKKSKYKLDGSVFNMYSEESIRGILELSPKAKFIILLRDPVEACISMHKQRLKYVKGGMRELSLDFLECWNMIEKRKQNECFPKKCRNKFLFRYDLLYSYEKYIPMLKRNIKEENLFIGFYSDYKNNPNLFYKKIFDFLQIENYFIDNKHLNDSLIVKDSKNLTFLNYIINKTIPIRKYLGLSGNKYLSNIRKKIFKLYTVKLDNKNDDLSEVKEFFKDTYEYLDKLKINNK
ncbi:sulfotransferase domain-containing protein [Aliarcobacter cryaerophilus]|uniref:sulfotransferase domain-containing protein n=1 Tax=Aliarcobacter cryaerophilus TaxID=28198 RepID=UPI000EAD9B65|nr:sulfotransferase domain-containing protein [Aliarcobacter cryaerophilus]AYJ78401.1 sulfotransferase [Aliarcobacter cryaerophilus D2610]